MRIGLDQLGVRRHWQDKKETPEYLELATTKVRQDLLHWNREFFANTKLFSYHSQLLQELGLDLASNKESSNCYLKHDKSSSFLVARWPNRPESNIPLPQRPGIFLYSIGS